LNYLDLFSGIGGFALGAYWAGMRFDEHYFSEVDEYAIKVYRKRFPDAIPLGDIKEINTRRLMADSISRGSQDRWSESYKKTVHERDENLRPEIKELCRDGWTIEPDVGRVAHGISSRVDRLKCLGNAIVPQIAEILFRRIGEIWEE